MTEVAFMKRIDENDKALLLKLHSHLSECVECKNEYEKLLAFNDVANELAYSTSYEVKKKTASQRNTKIFVSDTNQERDRSN